MLNSANAAVNADVAECDALTRAAAKHTPRNGNKNNANQTERRGDAAPERSPFVGTCAATSFFQKVLNLTADYVSIII